MKRYSFVLVFALCTLTLLGCSATKFGGEAVKISTVRPAPAGISEIAKSISRNVYITALEGSRGAGNIRIVPLVVPANQAPASPEFRIFNVRKGGVGDVLGLQNADVLVAAHDYVIREPAQFYAYLKALVQEKESQIEIRREGKPLLLRYSFVD